MSNSRILVVEDDTDTQLGLSVRLQASGYSVSVAPDATTAVMTARKDAPNLVLLDLGLPGGGGFRVLERLKSHPELNGIPVVVLTAIGSSASREKCMRMGAAAFFRKPADNADLMETIDRLVRRQSPEPVGA